MQISKQAAKRKILEAALVGVRHYLIGQEGQQDMGAESSISITGSAGMEIKVPSPAGPTYFTVTVKERF